MSNIVFILGAGCSKLAGAPLIAEFLDTASRLHTTGQVGHKNDHFQRVFKAIGLLQAVHSKAQLDLYNIESVFNAFEIANTIKKLPGFTPDEIPQVIQSLKEVIVATLENTVVFPTRGSTIGIPRPYDLFANLVNYLTGEATPKRTVSVITFNYDIAIDAALHISRIPYDYCTANTDCSVMPLLKLHGSLNWASRRTDNTIIPLTLSDYFRHYSVRFPQDYIQLRIPIGTQLKDYFSNHSQEQVNDEPFIVPPTWNKGDQYSSISSVWSGAAYDLTEAEYIFIVGYSLPQTDAFFRLLYALGTVSNTPLKSIQVFNPDSTADIQERFESMLGSGAKARYQYYPLTFEDANSLIRDYFR
jgi:hypothetical protein